jgi:hypothetical protein
MTATRPSWAKLGSECDHHEHRKAFDALDHEIKKLQAGRVEPVGIFQDDQDRPLGR